jgi:hypothetical protein
MATLNATRGTLLDVVRMMDPTGKLMSVAEVLAQTNEMLKDIPWVQSNGPTQNVVTVRSSLPTAAFARINRGIAAQKATTEQLQDTMGVLDMNNEVHDLMENVAAGQLPQYRWKQDQAFLESMAQMAAQTFVYGNEDSNPAAFTGLAPRFGATTATYGSQLVLGGGASTDNTSIWIVDWGEDSVYGIHPPGVPAGLQTEDMGRQRVTDGDGYAFWAWVSRFKWSLGLVVENYKHVARICNIDASDLADAGESGYAGANLVSLLVKALHKMDPPGGRRRVIYANETALTALDLLANNKSTLAVGYREYAGEEVLSFRQYPIRRVDQITVAEATIS